MLRYWLVVTLVACVSGCPAFAGEPPGVPSAAPEPCLPGDIMAAVSSAVGPVTACFEGDLALRLDASGKYMTRFMVEADGHVGPLRVDSDAPGDAVFRLCLANAIQDVRFVRPRGGVCRIKYPFAFNVAPEAPAYAAEIPTGVVATVNGVAVIAPGSAKRFAEIVRRLTPLVPPAELFGRARVMLVRGLIEDEILRQRAGAWGIHGAPETVAPELARVRAHFPTESAYVEFAEREAGGLPQFESAVRFAVMQNRLLEKSGYLPVDRSRLEGAWRAYRDWWTVPERAVVGHIQVSLTGDATPAEVEAAASRLDAVRTELSRPDADFGAVARRVSDAPDAAAGGDLGTVTRKRLPKAMEDAVFSLPIGVLSEPIRTRGGLHIVRVVERQPTRTLTVDELEKAEPGVLESVYRAWVRAGLVASLLPTTRLQTMTADAAAAIVGLGFVPWQGRDEIDPTLANWPHSRLPPRPVAQPAASP